jgi:RNA polymerase sigma-70 factor (ECF subfamily)
LGAKDEPIFDPGETDSVERPHPLAMTIADKLVAMAGIPADEPVPPSLEDVLVRRAKAGDPQAFRRLFERHAPAVRRFLFDLLRDDAAADEAVQETFVRAHARLPSLRESDKLSSWLFSIARYVFQEELRARRRHPVASSDAEVDSPDPAMSPEGLLMGREADVLLEAAMLELAEERRAALLLRIDHRLEYREIAEIMEWPLQKVKNEIHRARLTLRAKLAGYVEADDDAV